MAAVHSSLPIQQKDIQLILRIRNQALVICSCFCLAFRISDSSILRASNRTVCEVFAIRPITACVRIPSRDPECRVAPVKIKSRTSSSSIL